MTILAIGLLWLMAVLINSNIFCVLYTYSCQTTAHGNVLNLRSCVTVDICNYHFKKFEID